jgi:hypothetical protein
MGGDRPYSARGVRIRPSPNSPYLSGPNDGALTSPLSGGWVAGWFSPPYPQTPRFVPVSCTSQDFSDFSDFSLWPSHTRQLLILIVPARRCERWIARQSRSSGRACVPFLITTRSYCLVLDVGRGIALRPWAWGCSCKRETRTESGPTSVDMEKGVSGTSLRFNWSSPELLVGHHGLAGGDHVDRLAAAPARLWAREGTETRG